MSRLACQNLTCGYGNRAVLSGLSITVEPGECVALLGANGSGKSTLLKTLVGSIPSMSGAVTVDGTELSGLSNRDIATLIAFVPQEEPQVFPFTVRDLVTMGRFAVSTTLRDTSEDHAKATESMRFVDCEHLQDRRITELSGGERQRVLIARCLAQDAPIVLLDEPTSHLDIEHQLSIARLLRSLASEGRTVIAAIHDINLAALFATRIVLLAHGSVALDASTKEALSSDQLDRAYGVTFTRVSVDSDRVVLVAS